MTRNDIATELKQLVEEVPPRLDACPEDDLNRKPSPEKWSRKEILGHLVDSALHNWQRFAKAQFAPQPFGYESYDQDSLVIVNQYGQLPVKEIVSLWVALNRQIIHVLDHVPGDKLDYITIHAGSGGQNSLLWLMEDYLVHLKHHLQQIFETH